VQSGGKTVDRAQAGQRTAVNLAGIEHTALRRGMTLATPGKFRVTRRIDALLELLPSAPKMKQRTRVHFHSGTSETIAEAFVHSSKELAPGQSAFVQLRFQDDVLLLPGDRFIVRQFSPVTTIGGGVVLDPLARRPTVRDTGRVAFLETIERGDKIEILAAMTERALLGLTLEEIVARTGWTADEITATAKNLLTTGRVIAISAEPLALLARKVSTRSSRKLIRASKSFTKKTLSFREYLAKICGLVLESAYGQKPFAPPSMP